MSQQPRGRMSVRSALLFRDRSGKEARMFPFPKLPGVPEKSDTSLIPSRSRSGLSMGGS